VIGMDLEPPLAALVNNGPPSTHDAYAAKLALLEMLVTAEVAFVLAAAGVAAIATWAAHPRRTWLAVTAVALTGLGVVTLILLPASTAGFFFFSTAAASFLMEALVLPGFGLHAAGGAFAVAVAGLCLNRPDTGPHPLLVVPVALLAAGATFTAGRRSWRYIRADPFAAPARVLGREAVLLAANGHTGHAVVGGQVWTVAGDGTILHPGQIVRVTAVAADQLCVEPVTQAD
jgi:membrane-bound ClpP family serine protease